MKQPNFWLHLLLMISVLNEITPRLEFTNFVCTSTNKKFGEFEHCLLKSVNRTYKYLSLKLTIYQKPVTNMTVNFALYKRGNDYKPFLYNISLDGCRYLKNQKSNPVTQYFYGFIKDVSNLNHSCPYNEDFIVEKLSLDMINHRITAMLPFPDGEYLFRATWTANNKHVIDFKLYLHLNLNLT